MTKFSLKNKVALITGGGSGIGKAISLTFAAQEAKVHILDFNLEGANKTVAEIEKLGATAAAHQPNLALAAARKIWTTVRRANAAGPAGTGNGWWCWQGWCTIWPDPKLHQH